MKTLLMCLLCVSIYAQDKAFDFKGANKLFQTAKFANLGKKNVSIKDLINNDTLNYQSLTSENYSIGFTSDNIWVKFKLKNTEAANKVYYLKTARAVTDKATLYQIAGEKIKQFKSGDQIKFKDRQIAHRETVFKIMLPQKSTQTFYLHLLSDGETINIPLQLFTQQEFLLSNYKQQLFLGLFYGFLLLAGIVYLFFYTSLTEKTFLYYGLYVLSIALMQGALDGFIFQYIFPNGGYLNSRAVMLTALCSNFFLLKYCEYFLKVRSRSPKLYKGFVIIYGVIVILFIMLFVSDKTLELTYPIANLNGLLSLIFILATLVMMIYRKIKIDPYFSAGIFFLVIGLLGFVMNNLSLLPNTFLTLNSAKFGSGLEVLFLSLSMTNLIKKLRLDKEQSQAIALKNSEEISALKTYFMSNMSHELRTPINAIMGIAEEQIEKCNNTQNRKNFEIIKNASLSLLSNVNDILDFEKIEKNQLQLQHEAFNPSIILNQINLNWKTEAEKKGLTYAFDLDYNIPPKVKGDKERFVQILNNILSNAVKFTSQGHISVKIDTALQPKGTIRFSISVSDTGIGMPPEILNYVFDSFNQMKHDNKRKFGGIGLGLTIVKHLVELFKGDIHIESKEGLGTKVFIDLPMETIPACKKPKNLSQKDPLSSLKILVVEDNKMNQLVMKKLLGSTTNFTFAVVENGKEALEALKNDVYDIVLMDLQMPIMDGYEATKIIRSGYLGSTIENIPIIAVTADAMQETKQRVLDIGMNDYMTKPVNKMLLIEKINQCHERHLKVV